MYHGKFRGRASGGSNKDHVSMEKYSLFVNFFINLFIIL